MDQRDTGITRPVGVNTWRAGCGGSRTSGSGGGPQKRTGRKTGTALRTDLTPNSAARAKGIFYHLYVLIDIFSRYNPGWLISTCEESNLAADFIAGAIRGNGTAPHSVHADRGTSMTSKPVSMLLTDLGVTRSHSRPHVSNDNPFSEAQFRTLKYLPEFPHHFNSLEHAKRFCTEFFYQYNYIHRHSGIGWHTPASVHFGTADAINDARRTTLTAAFHANPARFGRRPHPPVRPDNAWINQPQPAPPE